MRRIQLSIGKLVACGALAVGALGGQAGEALAVPGLARVDAASVTDSSAGKTVTADCPAGQRVVGGGGDVANGGGEVVLDRLQPEAAMDGVERFVVGANEDGTGYGDDWQLTAYALCADPLPGQQILSATPPTGSSDSSQGSNVFCPAGQGQVGWGGRVNNGAGQVRITGLFQFYVGAPPIGTVLNAREDTDGYADSWSLSSYTVCADGVPETNYYASASAASSQDKSATVACPPGTQVHAAGGNLLQGATSPTSLVIDGMTVDPSLSSVTVDAAEDETGTSANWTVIANALCLP
jgi:hypothetical protein